MEVGVRIIGVVLRLLDLLLAPLFWWRGRRARGRRPPLPPPRDPLLHCSFAQLATAVRARQITSEKLTQLYINRIQEVNPYLNAVVDERFRAALEDAREADRRLAAAAAGGDRTLDELFEGRPLYGVPFTVKESCSLAGLSNAVGCLERVGSRAATDGAAVRRMRSAGGVPLLVSNTPELCLGWESANLVCGATRNPHCLARTPGGSSGGEAALVAAGASAAGVASDVAGSIRIPAAFCGVFGHKPTPGVVSIDGHVPTLTDPLFARLLAVGPLTRFAEDLTLLLRVMAGDAAQALRLDEPVDIRDLKVLYMTSAGRSMALLPVSRPVRAAVVAAANHLQACGATLSDTKFEEFEDSVEMSISVFFSMTDIPNMLQDPADPKRDRSLVIELLRSLLGGGTRSLQALGFTLIARTLLFIPASRQRHYRAAAERLRDRIVRELGSTGVLICPAHAGPAHARGRVFTRAAGVLHTMVFNVLGLPATVVPMGVDTDGLPIAVQVVAAPQQDRLCLAAARQLERQFGGWRAPGPGRDRPTTDRPAQA